MWHDIVLYKSRCSMERPGLHALPTISGKLILSSKGAHGLIFISTNIKDNWKKKLFLRIHGGCSICQIDTINKWVIVIYSFPEYFTSVEFIYKHHYWLSKTLLLYVNLSKWFIFHVSICIVVDADRTSKSMLQPFIFVEDQRRPDRAWR